VGGGAESVGVEAVRLVELRSLLRPAEIMLDLTPEELGGRIITAMKKSPPNTEFIADDAMDALYPRHGNLVVTGFPEQHESAVEQALLEAWSWLEAQGLLVKAGFANGANGWRRLSRQAVSMGESEFDNFVVARMLPRRLLHSSLEARVWSDFVRGPYDSAVLFAAKQVEIAVRKAVDAGSGRYGVALVSDAFNEEHGKLTELNAHIDERKGRRNMFMGFIGAYKNPLSHRDLDISDPAEAVELVLMASHLLPIVDLRSSALLIGKAE
jgi:uncharacterized protein (TIGR02391 family)